MSERIFHMAVLGRTLEHLGVQMYKRRDTALAELVANSWDASASRVWLTVPDANYDQQTSTYIVEDDGAGMSPDEVQQEYLVVGRNRRAAAERGDANRPGAGHVEETAPDTNGHAPAGPEHESGQPADGADGELLGALNEMESTRRIMGRKGIGKLAGFGIATMVELTTWRAGVATMFTLNLADLKLNDSAMADIDIKGTLGPVPDDVRSSDHGTRIVLRDLKHSTGPEIERLRESLARRFSRTVRGRMSVFVNDEPVVEPSIDWEFHVPPAEDKMELATLPSGEVVRYTYGFSKTVLGSRELRGFTVLTHGKTAQAPPFFFDVETRASGQHGTKYLSGTIEADFIDDGVDDKTDLVSTDRQEIDWEAQPTQDLLAWGQRLTRRALAEFRDRRAEGARERVQADEGLRARLDRLDPASRKRALKLLGNLGLLDHDAPGKELELASSLIAAFEYQQFHDVVDQIEAAEDDPAKVEMLLSSMSSWRVLEGRAILEVIRGRLSIIDKFHSMIVNDAPETAHRVGDENMHDLIAGFPWLLHPEWQVLSEEKSISKQLIEWSADELAESLSAEERRQRYDFLALADERQLILIEIKRAFYAPDYADVQRLVQYKINLEQGTEKDIVAVFVSSKQFVGRSETIERLPVELYSWAEIHDRTRAYYDHYRALLEGDLESPDFYRKSREVARTRSVLDKGVYRDRGARAAGIGEQDEIRPRMGRPSAE